MALIAGQFPFTVGQAVRPNSPMLRSGLAHLGGVLLLEVRCGFMQISGPLMRRGRA